MTVTNEAFNVVMWN